MNKDIYILGNVRTAIGTFGGSLVNTAPTELGALVAEEAICRSNIDPKEIINFRYMSKIPTFD